MWAGQRQIRLRTYWFFLCEKKMLMREGEGKRGLKGNSHIRMMCRWWFRRKRQLGKNYNKSRTYLDFYKRASDRFSQMLCSLDNCMTTPWLDVDFVLITTFMRAWKLHKMTSTWLAVDFWWTLPRGQALELLLKWDTRGGPWEHGCASTQILTLCCTSPQNLSDLYSQIVLQFSIQYKLKPIGDNYDFWMAV